MLVTPGSWDKAEAKLDDASADAKEQNNIGLTGKAGTLELVYNPTTLVLTVTGSVRAQITLDEEFNIFGSVPGLNWSGNIADGVMTKNADTGLYEYKITSVKAGKFEYKILQDCDDKGWTYAYGESGELGAGNAQLVVDVDNSEVLFTIDPATLEVKVTVTAPSTPAGDDETPAAGDETPAAGDETPAAGEDTTPADGNTENPSDGNVNAGDSMAVAAAVIAVVAACGIVVVSFKKRRQDA